MTHTTRIYITEPCDPEAIFGNFRKAIGIPPTHPFDVEVPGSATMRLNHYANVTRIKSIPGGFNAALDVDICPDGKVECCCNTHWKDGETQTDNPEECETREEFFLAVWLDTSYSGAPDLGCLQCYHMRLAKEALGKLDIQKLWFQNENTGAFFTQLGDACDQHGAVFYLSAEG